MVQLALKMLASIMIKILILLIFLKP